MDFDNLERLRRGRARGAARPISKPLGQLHVAPEAGQSDRQSHDPALTFGGAVLALLTAAVVILAPFHHGGNRPVVWGGVAFVLAFALATGQALALWRGAAPRAPLAGAGAGPWLALVVPVFAAVQMIPFGGIEAGLPEGFTSATISLSPDATALGLVRLFSAALVFLAVLAAASRRRRARRLAWAIFGGALLHAGIAMADLGDGSATGRFANHNSFAAFAGMGLILGLSLALSCSPRASGGQLVRALERALLWAALLFLLVALVASQSRLGVASAALGLGVTLTLHHPPRRKTLGWGGAALLVALALAGGGLAERVALLGPDAETRLELHRQVAGMIAARPLSGFGLDSFPLAFEIFHRPPVSSAFVWDHAHNSYLALWSELGLVVGSAPVLAVILVAGRLWGGVRRGTLPDPLAVAALGVIAAQALHAAGDFSLEIAGNLYLFLAVLALGLSGRQRGQTAMPKEPAPR